MDRVDEQRTFHECLDEEVGGGELLPQAPEAAEPEPSLAERAQAFAEDAVETARDAGRWVRGALDHARAAADLEGRIEALGPGDGLRLSASASARVTLGVAASQGLEVRRRSDGGYLVAGSAELGVTFGQKLEGGWKALQSLGVEQGGAARVELTCASPGEAAQVVRALRNAQLRQLGVPVGDAGREAVLLASKLSAVELGAKSAAAIDAKVAGLELRAGVKSEQSARVELSGAAPMLVLVSSVSADGGAPKRLRDLLPRTSAATPPASALSLGPPLKGTVKVEQHTRVPLEGDLAQALAGARSRLTFSAESRASVGVAATGREAKVSVEATFREASALAQAWALGDGARLAGALDVRAELEARPFQELGGEVGFGLSAGAAGGSVGLEARLRDVQPERGVKRSGTLGELLAWLAE